MKEENVKSEYQRKVDKSLIPTCNIMGVNIAAINMNWLLKYIDENLSDIKGDYICVSNVHTTVTSYEDNHYRREKSKSLAWSSVVLAFENSKRISEEVKKPKALGDIRGVSYIYPILWRFGLIRVPEAIEKKMGK